MKTVKFTVLGEPTGKGRPQTKVMYSEKGFKNKKTGKVRNTLVNNVTPKRLSFMRMRSKRYTVYSVTITGSRTEPCWICV